MQKKLHNPKSFAPAVYIPCWLIQISIKLLSHAAKLTYGRLSQWANESGIVYRSVPQLAEEIGCSEGSVEKYLKELRDVGLIGTYHPQAGGVNHFEFYDHEWMHSPINEHLVYKNDKTPPPPNLTVPPSESYGTPPPNLTDINNKEIKEIKSTTTSSKISFENYKEQEKQTAQKTNESHSKEELKSKFKTESLNDEKCNQVFKERFHGLDISIEELYQECVDYWSQQNQLVFKSRFLTHLKKSPLDKYRKIDAHKESSSSQPETHEQRMKRFAEEREQNRKKMGINY